MSLGQDSYGAWKGDDLADPRTASAARVVEGMARIVAVEGPLLQSLLYARYVQGTPGLSKAGRVVREALDRAFRLAVDHEEILVAPDADTDGGDPAEVVVRVETAPAIHLRTRGGRTLQDVPLGELAALFVQIRRLHRVARYDEWLQRKVLQDLELVRLTDRARERLDRAWEISERWLADDAVPEFAAASTNRVEERSSPAPGGWEAFSVGRKPYSTRSSD